MTIQDPEKFCAGLWDWSILQGCFGETKIEPTDIEGFVERNGKFLILETKAPGVEIKFGQLLTFRRLVETGLFTVLVIWGNTNEPEKIKTMTKRGEFEYENASLDKLRDFVGKWFDYANQSEAPRFSE